MLLIKYIIIIFLLINNITFGYYLLLFTIKPTLKKIQIFKKGLYFIY